MGRPGGSDGRRLGTAGAHQHGAVDVGGHYQDAEQNGSDDRPLQAEVVGASGHRQARQVRVPASEGDTGEGFTRSCTESLNNTQKPVAATLASLITQAFHKSVRQVQRVSLHMEAIS